MGTSPEFPPDAIGAALFGATRQAMLRTLFGHADRRFYQRQLIRMLGSGSGAVQRELAQLARAGIITRTVEGNQTYFQANRGCPVFRELCDLVRKTFGVSGVLKEALQPLAGSIRVAFIYGSIAEGRETASSDVDVMIIGDQVSLDHVIELLSKAQDSIGREVNPSVYTTAEYRRKLAAGQHFLSSLATVAKIFLIGSDSELTRLAEVRMAEGAQGKPARDRGSLRTRRPRS